MIEEKIIEVEGKKVVMRKVTHENLPAYIMVPVDESWFKPTKTIGNMAEIKKTKSRYYYAGEPRKQYYETITYENS